MSLLWDGQQCVGMEVLTPTCRGSSTVVHQGTTEDIQLRLCIFLQQILKKLYYTLCVLIQTCLHALLSCILHII